MPVRLLLTGRKRPDRRYPSPDALQHFQILGNEPLRCRMHRRVTSFVALAIDAKVVQMTRGMSERPAFLAIRSTYEQDITV